MKSTRLSARLLLPALLVPGLLLSAAPWAAAADPAPGVPVPNRSHFRIPVSDSAAAERQIFLLIGQSNMAGRAAIEDADREPVEGAYLWNIGEGSWVHAVPPYNLYSPSRKEEGLQRLNCGPSFVRAWRERHPEAGIGIVCAARGGSSLSQWDRERPDEFDLYRHAVEAARAALASGGELRGILWHQGESDSGNAGRLANYPERLARLVANLREDLEAPEVPFVFAQIGQWKESYAAFNDMILTVPPTIERSACVTTEGLANFDEAHFDTEAQRELGRRYAAALASLDPED